MGLRSRRPDASRAATVAAVTACVDQHASEWFPEAGNGPVTVHQLTDTRRSQLFAVHVGGDPAGIPQIIAKRRLRHTASGAGSRGTRPTLSNDRLSEDELTAFEYRGLASIFNAFGTEDGRFRAIRPLAHLQEHDTILMEFVPGTTLKKLLVRESRFAAGRTVPRAGEDTWCGVGAWLRTYQRATPPDGRPSRQSSREEVVQQIAAYDRFLAPRVGLARWGELGRRAQSLAEESLPAQLALAAGHGDFAPRNVQLGLDGRITVFDPLVRWAVPAQEDLCRFLVGMRLLGLQVHTGGAAFARSAVERREEAVVHGYYGDQVPWRALRAFELMVLLDKWSALADLPSIGPRNRARRLSLSLAGGYLLEQAVALVRLAESADR